MIRPASVLLLVAAPTWAQAPSAAKSGQDAHDFRGIWQTKTNAYRALRPTPCITTPPLKIPKCSSARGRSA